MRIQSLLPLCLAALVPAHLPAQGVASSNAQPVKALEASGLPWEAVFVDVADDAGLDLVFTYGGRETKDYIIESNGSGVAFLDYDGDSRLDVFLVNGSTLARGSEADAPTSRLYRNVGDGRFEDGTAQSGLGRSGWGSAVCAGDYDNDGRLDLFVAYWGRDALYRNNWATAGSARRANGRRRRKSGPMEFRLHLRRLRPRRTARPARDAVPAVRSLRRPPPPGKTSNCEWKGMPVYCGPPGPAVRRRDPVPESRRRVIRGCQRVRRRARRAGLLRIHGGGG